MEWRPRHNQPCQILCQSVKGFLGGSTPKMAISYTFSNDPYNSTALSCNNNKSPSWPFQTQIYTLLISKPLGMKYQWAKNNNNLRLLESRHTAQPTHRHNQQAATQGSTSTSTGTQARYNNNRVLAQARWSCHTTALSGCISRTKKTRRHSPDGAT